MMKKRYLIILLSFVAWPYMANAQVGKQFWFAAPEMAQHSKDMSLLMYLSAQEEGAEVYWEEQQQCRFHGRFLAVPAGDLPVSCI